MNSIDKFNFNLVLYNKNGEPKYTTENNNYNFPDGSSINIGDILEINIKDKNSSKNSIEFINLKMDIENSNTYVNIFEKFNRDFESIDKFNVSNKTYLHNVLCVIKIENRYLNKNFDCSLEILDIFDNSIHKTENVSLNYLGDGYIAILFKINSDFATSFFLKYISEMFLFNSSTYSLSILNEF